MVTSLFLTKECRKGEFSYPACATRVPKVGCSDVWLGRKYLQAIDRRPYAQLLAELRAFFNVRPPPSAPSPPPFAFGTPGYPSIPWNVASLRQQFPEGGMGSAMVRGFLNELVVASLRVFA